MSALPVPLKSPTTGFRLFQFQLPLTLSSLSHILTGFRKPPEPLLANLYSVVRYFPVLLWPLLYITTMSALPVPLKSPTRILALSQVQLPLTLSLLSQALTGVLNVAPLLRNV